MVCDPDAAAANRDPARAVTDRDRLANSSCRRIDARHRVGERVRDPHRIVAERDARRSGIDSDLITQPVAVRVDQSDSVRRYRSCVRLAAPRRQNARDYGRGRCDGHHGGRPDPLFGSEACERSFRLALETCERCRVSRWPLG